MVRYDDIFAAILKDFKREITIIPRTRGAGDAKGRATWDEGEPFVVSAIVQRVQNPINAGERATTTDADVPLNIFISLNTPLNQYDLIEVDGVRYAITTLHKTDLQVELTVKKAI